MENSKFFFFKLLRIRMCFLFIFRTAVEKMWCNLILHLLGLLSFPISRKVLDFSFPLLVLHLTLMCVVGFSLSLPWLFCGSFLSENSHPSFPPSLSNSGKRILFIPSNIFSCTFFLLSWDFFHLNAGTFISVFNISQFFFSIFYFVIFSSFLLWDHHTLIFQLTVLFFQQIHSVIYPIFVFISAIMFFILFFSFIFSWSVLLISFFLEIFF